MLFSHFSGRCVRSDTAMTGEIALRGRLLAVSAERLLGISAERLLGITAETIFFAFDPADWLLLCVHVVQNEIFIVHLRLNVLWLLLVVL